MRIPCSVFIICMLASGLGVQAANLFIDPATQDSPSAGETLTIHVRVEEVTDLSDYQQNQQNFSGTIYISSSPGNFIDSANGMTEWGRR